MKISIVIAVYHNEGAISKTHEGIQRVFASMPEHDYELVFVDDGSKDGSLQEILGLREHDSRVKAITFTRNFGQMAAMLAGFKEATGAAVINMSADLQDPVDLIPQMIEKWEAGSELVVCFRAERADSFSARTTSRLAYGLLRLPLPDIPKGGFDLVRAQGLENFRRRIAALVPFIAGRLGELGDWTDIKLLTVAVDRLQRWHRPGFLCIGDAAHAMSPIGGVGINLAIQDAVATANILAEKLRVGKVVERDLAAVERRRMLPTRLTQGLQILMQDRLIGRVLTSRTKLRAPLVMRWLLGTPLLRRIPARLLAVGFRPEHVRSQLFQQAIKIDKHM